MELVNEPFGNTVKLAEIKAKFQRRSLDESDVAFLLSEIDAERAAHNEHAAELCRVEKELKFWKKAAETQKNNNLKLLEENRKLQEERQKHIELFVSIKTSIDEFCQLVGVNPETTSVEEKAQAFNHKLQSIQQERDKLIAVAKWYANPNNEEPGEFGGYARYILKEIGVGEERKGHDRNQL